MPVSIGNDSSRSLQMENLELDALIDHNARQVNEMNIAAAGLVMSLIDVLAEQGRNTFIRLHNPAPRGHTVEYALVDGDPALVPAMAEFLGFKSWDQGRLEVAHG